MNQKMRVVVNAPVVICFVALMFLATILGMVTGGASTKLLFQIVLNMALSFSVMMSKPPDINEC